MHNAHFDTENVRSCVIFPFVMNVSIGLHSSFDAIRDYLPVDVALGVLQHQDVQHPLDVGQLLLFHHEVLDDVICHVIRYWLFAVGSDTLQYFLPFLIHRHQHGHKELVPPFELFQLTAKGLRFDHCPVVETF